MNASSLRRAFAFAATLSVVFAGAAGSVRAEAEESEKGAWIDRADGTRLNLRIESQTFELHFYDAAKQVQSPDAAQAVLHCTSRVAGSRETLALVPEAKDNKTILRSPRVIQPPYQFDILLVLNFDEADKAVESHHLTFVQESEK